MAANIKAPIWKDIYYTSTAYTILDYAVQIQGANTIYTGRAYQRPGGNGVSINISKICQDYIKDSFNGVDFRDYAQGSREYTHPNGYVEFNLLNASNGTLLETYGFVYDWSYEEWNGNGRNISKAINGHYVQGMYILNTNLWDTPSSQFSFELRTQVMREYYPTQYCGEIALYYKNRYGGWDSFLIEGTWTKKDEYTKYTYNRSFNNNTLEFENGTYHSQIVTSYVLNTGWLNDQESDSLAFNLLSSNEVYLHNLCTNKVYPVVIKDNTATYKTYKNNSRKLVNYQINVEESQRKEVL